MRLRVVALLFVACGRIGFDPICGLEGPCVTNVQINGGDEYARGPRLNVVVRATGESPLEVRVSESCTFADDSWQPIDEPHWAIVEPKDGAKTVCAWARDATGAVSNAEVLLGANADAIIYEAEHVPVVESFDVTPVGNQLHVTWTVADREGLAGIELDYSTIDIDAGMWMPLVRDFAATGTRATGTIDVDLPATDPLVVRIVPIDRAHNRGYATTSDVIGAPGWRVYAGTRDRGIGSAAHAAWLLSGWNYSYQVTIDPATHDVYASGERFGVVRLDAATGVVVQFMAVGATTNLPDDGPLPATPIVPRNPALRFGPDGKLYVSSGDDYSDNSSVVYQIDVTSHYCRRYLGGGTGNSATATAANVFIWKWIFEFDEDGSMYFMTSCAPGATNPQVRMLKATQNADGTAGAISIVAGNCVAGTLGPGGPYPAATSPMQGFQYVAIGTIVPWDHGRVVYYASYPGTVWKIIDGQLYSTSAMTELSGTLAYDRATDTLYAATRDVVAYRPSLTGAGGEQVLGTLTGNIGTGDCTADGLDPLQACANPARAMVVTPQRMYFVDGPVLNQTRWYRLRFIDSAGALRTYLGSPQLSGDEGDSRAMRALIAGISYKPPTAPNQAAFPEGLYFVDPFALVFGRIDPGGQAHVLWGNQSNFGIEYATGDAIGKDRSLGHAYGGGTMHALAFDDMGLPWLRYDPRRNVSHLIKVGNTGTVVQLQNGVADWETAADGVDPSTLEEWPYAVITNLPLKGQAAFLIGGYSVLNPTATIRILDFTSSTTTRIMGSGTNGFSADRNPGLVASASLSGSCIDSTSRCYIAYRSDQDRLYFSEDTRLRYITTPSNTATATLVTLFTATLNIYNFSFRPDGSQLYYIGGDGQLRCHDISSGAPSCNDAVLGPPAVLGPMGLGADQLTWRDNNTLLISPFNGQVYEYSVP